MKISKVELFNFRCFDKKIISFNEEKNIIRPFTVLIGDNSIGKTTILEAIAKAFVPVLRAINKNVLGQGFSRSVAPCKGSDPTMVRQNLQESLSSEGLSSCFR